MTLHWWMHWFWVTSVLTLLVCSGQTLPAAQSEELQHITTDLELDIAKHAERQGRAMYLMTKSSQVTTTKVPPVNNTTTNISDIINSDHTNPTTPKPTNNTREEVGHPSVIKWPPINSTRPTNYTKSDIKNITEIHNNTMPIMMNFTETQNSSFSKKTNLTTNVIGVKDDLNVNGASESRIVTEKPLSLETAFLQTRVPPDVESSRRIIDAGGGGLDTGAIAGISFAALVLGALAGSTAFVLYRRRYLNKPQTLNDKCSNPDSSGYLDDSTIRDNSEEMYSLDNDSFLNSLEAMTIQNYWTDTVKHTKL